MIEGKRSRRRDVLVGILGVIACVAITQSATTVWVHQVALNTDRYVTVVSRVATNPEVVEEVSSRLADQVVEQFDIPRLVKPLLRNWIQEQTATFMGSDFFLDAWAGANRATHTALVRLLRSDSVLNPSDGQVSISVLPVIVVGLQRLQEVGLLPDDLNLPDPSDSGAPEAIREAIAERLGIDLPPDFGEVPLVSASQLETLRQFVTIFDIIAVASVILAVALVVLTIWLARNRRRAIMFLGLGAAVAVLLAQLATVGISRAVANALGEGGSRNTLTALLDAMLGELATALTVVLIIGVVAAVAAWVMGRQSTPPMQTVPAGAVPVESTPIEPPPSAKPRTTAPAKPRTKPPAKPRTKPPAKPPAKRSRNRTSET